MNSIRIGLLTDTVIIPIVCSCSPNFDVNLPIQWCSKVKFIYTIKKPTTILLLHLCCTFTSPL